MAGTSADSNSPWELRPRTVTVIFAKAELFVFLNLQRTVISR